MTSSSLGQLCAVFAFSIVPCYIILAYNGTHVSLKHVDATIKITKFGLESTLTRFRGKTRKGNGIKNSLVIMDIATFSVLHALNNCVLSVGLINIISYK